MYLYYELCEKLWGGSPATQQIETGIETEEVNQQVDANQQVDVNEQVDISEREDCSDGDSEEQTEPSGGSGSSQCCSQGSTSEDSIQRKRRQALDETLSTYRHKRLKKRVHGDLQLLHLAEKELELKQQMAERLDSISKDHKETMTVLTQNLKAVSDTMSSAVALLQQSLMQRPSPSMPLYYNQYGYPPPPSPNLPGSSRHHTPPAPTTPRGSSQDYLADYDEYSQ